MLREIANVRQNEGEPLRRIFNDDEFYLILWFDKSKGDVISFQLFYSQGEQKSCATWSKEYGVSFRTVDDGESRPFRYKMAPVLKEEGIRPTLDIIESFKNSCRNLDFYIADKVVRIIEA